MALTEMESCQTHERFRVILHEELIETLVTHAPHMVDSWIADIERIHRRRLHKLIVGLDVEWRPNYSPPYTTNPVATLQLCVGRRCLIYQIIHAPWIPNSLVDFLDDADYTFVGVGIESDAQKLVSDYKLWVRNTVDLAELAARDLKRRELRNAGLKVLAREVLEVEVEKPKSVATSHWDISTLGYSQIHYACVDAFISFEIGRSLNASSAKN